MLVAMHNKEMAPHYIRRLHSIPSDTSICLPALRHISVGFKKEKGKCVFKIIVLVFHDNI